MSYNSETSLINYVLKYIALLLILKLVWRPKFYATKFKRKPIWGIAKQFCLPCKTLRSASKKVKGKSLVQNKKRSKKCAMLTDTPENDNLLQLQTKKKQFLKNIKSKRKIFVLQFLSPILTFSDEDNPIS